MDDPESHVRIVHTKGPLNDIAIISDGIVRLVLEFVSKTTSRLFFDGMFAPLKRRTAGARSSFVAKFKQLFR